MTFEEDMWYDLHRLHAEILPFKEGTESGHFSTFFSPDKHLDLVTRIVSTIENLNSDNNPIKDYHPWTQTTIGWARRIFPRTTKYHFMHYLVTSGKRMDGLASVEIEIPTPRDTPRTNYSNGMTHNCLVQGGSIDFSFITYDPRTLEIVEIGEGLKPDKEFFFGRIYMDPLFAEPWSGAVVWSRR